MILAQKSPRAFVRVSPFLKRAEEDLQRLHRQGEETLSSWKTTMKPFSHLWNKPFIVVLMASIFTGAVMSAFSSYLLVREDRKARALCETSFYGLAKKALEAKTSKPSIDNKVSTKTSVKTKKKEKMKQSAMYIVFWRTLQIFFLMFLRANGRKASLLKNCAVKSVYNLAHIR